MINTLSRIIQIKSTSSLISSFMNTYKINLYFTVKNLYKKSSPEVFFPQEKSSDAETLFGERKRGSM